MRNTNESVGARDDNGLMSGDGAAYIPVSAEDYEDLLSGKYD